MRKFYQLLVGWGPGIGYGVWDLGFLEENQIKAAAVHVVSLIADIEKAKSITIVQKIATMSQNEGLFVYLPFS
jgi:hypothetical protein